MNASEPAPIFRLLSRYVISTRYLRPVQILNRLQRLVRRKVLHRTDAYTSRYAQIAPPLKTVHPLVFPSHVRRSVLLEDLHQGAFTFLNRRVQLGQPIDWFPPHESQLWVHNLHYFDFAVSIGLDYQQCGNPHAYPLFRRLVSEWIDSCPIAAPLAWDPYPISLRLRNWIAAYTLFTPALEQDPKFALKLCHSLYSQALFLEDNLEYHLLHNHLLENGRALLLAGLFFSDVQAKRWRRKGQDILWHGLEDQVLDDGGHYERSPMYHQMMLDLYQETVAILTVEGEIIPPGVTRKLQSMQEWLRAVLHPDGQLPLLNDAAFGIANDPAHSVQDTAAACDGLTVLPESGYAIWRNRGQQDFLVFDCGPLGPDHQPAHGHCDTLSYELSLGGERIITDSGVSTYYGDLDWRTFYRSTRAHNTVVVDGAEQSEIWHRFRVARRAHPFDLVWESQNSKLTYVAASHNGYQRLPGTVTHRRWMSWVDQRFWVVCDRLSGRGIHHMESLIHFHPDVSVLSAPSDCDPDQPAEVARGQTTLRILPWGWRNVSTYYGEHDPLQGWYAPEFGLNLKNPVWGFSRVHSLPIWAGYVLSPESTPLICSISHTDTHSCRLIIQSPDGTYHIDYHSHDMTMAKTS